MLRTASIVVAVLLILAAVADRPGQAQKPQQSEFVQKFVTLFKRYRALEQQGRRQAAIEVAVRTLRLAEMAGFESEPVAIVLNDLGVLHQKNANYAKAVYYGERALKIRETLVGPDHPQVAVNLSNLGIAYKYMLRYEKAEAHYRRAIRILELAGRRHYLARSSALHNLGELLRETDRVDDALTMLQQALDIRVALLPEGHPRIATTQDRIANVYYTQQRFREAEPLLREALSWGLRDLGPNHPEVLQRFGSLGALLIALNRFDEAEKYLQATLAGQRRTHGGRHPNVAETLDALAKIRISRGRYEEAESLLNESVAIFENVGGGEHPRFLQSVLNLAGLHLRRGRIDVAQALLERVIATEQTAGRAIGSHLDDALMGLALLYYVAGLDDKSLALYDRLAPNHQNDGVFLHNKALLNIKLGQLDTAAGLLRRSVDISVKTYGPSQPDLADSLVTLGGILLNQGKAKEAEDTLLRASNIFEDSLGPRSLRLAGALTGVANAKALQRRYDDAVATSRRAVEIAHALISGERSAEIEQKHSVEIDERLIYMGHVQNTVLAAANNKARRDDYLAEGFLSAQMARRTAAGNALARMAARFAAGDGDLAGLVRQRQDALEKARAVELQVAKMYGLLAAERANGELGNLKTELSRLEATIRKIDARLRKDFSGYMELTNPQPIPVADIQRLLAPDEAMLVYLVGNQGSIYVWVIRQLAADFITVAMDAEELEDVIAELRDGVDLSQSSRLDELPRFDTRLAYDLYQLLFERIEPMLQGARTVLIVPDGALSAIPFGLLVTKPQAHPPMNLDEYREAPWLVRRYATYILPSVTSLPSLPSLRLVARPRTADKVFVGFGDPELSGRAGGASGVNFAALFRGGQVDVKALSEFAVLPSTADELRQIADALNAPDNAVFLRRQATERQVRGMGLSDYRIVAFATHGLVADEIDGLPEPALVLTPPAAPSREDDGLLTASEIAGLNLNADWVILSACNTAAGDRPGAEGLSGLAKAFFYAGSRALLVSHWPVASDAAVSLTTETFSLLSRVPTMSKARALQLSKLAMIEHDKRPEFVHPAFWAPFVLVGDDRPIR